MLARIVSTPGQAGGIPTSTVREITVRILRGVSFQLAVDRGLASWKLTPLISRTVLTPPVAGTGATAAAARSVHLVRRQPPVLVLVGGLQGRGAVLISSAESSPSRSVSSTRISGPPGRRLRPSGPARVVKSSSSSAVSFPSPFLSSFAGRSAAFTISAVLRAPSPSASTRLSQERAAQAAAAASGRRTAALPVAGRRLVARASWLFPARTAFLAAAFLGAAFFRAVFPLAALQRPVFPADDPRADAVSVAGRVPGRRAR